MASGFTVPAILAELSRGRLEELIKHSLRAGVPIPVQTLVDAVVAQRTGTGARRRRVSDATVGADAGPFSWLSDDLFALILDATPAAARLFLSTAVCKALRAASAAASPWHSVTMEDMRYFPTFGALRTGLTHGLGGLRSFLRSNGVDIRVLNLRFDQTPPPQDDRIVEIVAAAPNVVDLTLGGKRMSASVMKRVAALPCIPKLKRLAFGCNASKKTDAVKLLQRATALERLELGNGLEKSAFAQAYDAWQTARRGAPLLHALSFQLGGGCSAAYLSTLGTMAPDLRELRMPHFCFEVLTSERPLQFPAALRKLHLRFYAFANRDNDEYFQHCQYQMADTPSILRHVFAKVPTVEVLSVGWTRPHRMRDPAASTKPVGDALRALPKTLKTLTLYEVAVHDGAFDGLDLPALKSVTLSGCAIERRPPTAKTKLPRLPLDLVALRKRGVAVAVHTWSADH